MKHKAIENGSFTYRCKGNDVVIRLFEKDGEVDELHIAVSGEREWVVIGYEDIKKAVLKARRKFMGKTSHDYGGGYIGETMYNIEEETK